MRSLFKRVTTTSDSASAYVQGQVDVVSKEVKKTIETHIAPVRQSVLKRYPVLFTLLGIFGVATTYYGFERILAQYEILNTYPWLILFIGLGVLTFTGALYKKLH